MSNKPTNKLGKVLKDLIESLFSDFSFDIKISETDSYFHETGKGWEVSIKPMHNDTEFKIRVEFIDDVFKFEYSEDNYEEITDEKLFIFMFFDCLEKLERYKNYEKSR